MRMQLTCFTWHTFLPLLTISTCLLAKHHYQVPVLSAFRAYSIFHAMSPLCFRAILFWAAPLFCSPVSRFEFTWFDLALTSPLANQPVASESERVRDQWQCAAVTPQVNLSFSFVSCVSKHLIEFIAIKS